MKKTVLNMALCALMVAMTACGENNNSGTQIIESSSGVSVTVKGVNFVMKAVEGGTFQMGNPDPEHGDNGPAHSVTVKSFHIGETEVTQALWEAVMGNNPSVSQGANLPVENVSWDDCQKFIGKLNKKTGKNFRLPTEAEWEYAARGGNRSRGYLYAGSDNIDDVAWYKRNSGDKYLDEGWSSGSQAEIESMHFRTHEVKGKLPNELGLYDMSGNVGEWCSDSWYYYAVSPEDNPCHEGGDREFWRITRGGTYFFGKDYCSVWWRVNAQYQHEGRSTIGFRLVLPDV